MRQPVSPRLGVPERNAISGERETGRGMRNGEKIGEKRLPRKNYSIDPGGRERGRAESGRTGEGEECGES